MTLQKRYKHNEAFYKILVSILFDWLSPATTAKILKDRRDIAQYRRDIHEYRRDIHEYRRDIERYRMH